MTSKNMSGPVLTLSEIGDIFDLTLRCSAERDQLLARLRDGFPVEIFGVVVFSPAGHGLFTSYRKEDGK